MANPILPPDDEEPNEFAGMAPEQVAGWLYKRGGEQALRQAFQLADEAEPQTKESLKEIASALELRGLNAPAAILREIASETASELQQCPYKPGHDRDYWLHSRRQKRAMRSGEIKARLRPQEGPKEPMNPPPSTRKRRSMQAVC